MILVDLEKKTQKSGHQKAFILLDTFNPKIHSVSPIQQIHKKIKFIPRKHVYLMGKKDLQKVGGGGIIFREKINPWIKPFNLRNIVEMIIKIHNFSVYPLLY